MPNTSLNNYLKPGTQQQQHVNDTHDDNAAEATAYGPQDAAADDTTYAGHNATADTAMSRS